MPNKRTFIFLILLIILLLSTGIAYAAGSQPGSEIPSSEQPLDLSPTQSTLALAGAGSQLTGKEESSNSTATTFFFPLVFRQINLEPPPPMEELPVQLFCSSNSFEIPDNDSAGTSDSLTIEDPRIILDLDVRLDVEHTWIGDLVLSLTHQETGQTISLIDRPGISDGGDGCGEDDIGAILDDEISSPAEDKCSPREVAISGIYLPAQPLESFDGEAITGTWTLSVSDHGNNDAGQVNEWCLAAVIHDVYSPPPPHEPPPSVPDEASIQGLTGQSQALPLDCESRSAVDWAAYFGVQIGELDFFYNLPESDNPDLGFVGDVYGAWGQLPPYPYGVHAEPIAKLLQEYGVEAYAQRLLSWDRLRAEIAEGRPVIAWIVGSLDQGFYEYVVNGIPVYYDPNDGDLTVVARYEHTVVVTGYTQDSVTYLNGGHFETKSLDQFLDSWSVMRNMAVTAAP